MNTYGKTKIKLCGLTRLCDIQTANQLQPEYIGYVFAPQSKRYLPPEAAAQLTEQLSEGIQAVGVFVNQRVDIVADLLQRGVIHMAQLHGEEDASYIARLRAYTDCPIIQAFRIRQAEDVTAAMHSSADYLLLDSGAGTGETFNWAWLQAVTRPYFLAGGLTPANAAHAVQALSPYAVDVSSGIETHGRKDPAKMAAFVHAVRSHT